MSSEIGSGIYNVTSLNEDLVRKQRERKMNFEYWGKTPREARRVAVNKRKGLHDKRMSLKDAVERYVRDGINIGIGGFVNTRIPAAIVHQIVKRGAKELTLSFQSNSICAEWLAGAMIVNPDHVSIKRVELAWWGYEVIGIAPLLRYLTSNGMIELDDYTNYGMSARFKAAAMGLSFIPTRDHGGSDMELVNRGTMIRCPFTGENTYLVPACYPDLGIVHVNASDKYGNSRIFGSLCTCPEIAMASVDTIVTAETIIPTESIRNYPNLTEIPYPVVDAVCEQPLGGYPGAVYGHYWFDVEHFQEFRRLGESFRITGKKDKLKEYYDTYFFSCETFDDFIAKIPYKKIKELRQMDGNQPIIL